MPTTPWFVDAFTADYLDVYPHRDEAAAAREARGALALLGLDRGDRLLELAAGAGRHAVAFDAAGCRVTCVDLSADLVRRCAARGLPTVRADMRALPFRDGTHHAVTCLFSSFGYFVDEADHRRTLEEIARVLAPGGRALLDLMDRTTVAARLVPRGVDVSGGHVIETERRLVEGGRRVEKAIRLTRPDGVERRWLESVRLFTAEEIRRLAADAGLTVRTQVGDYDGRAQVPGETRRLVVLEAAS